MSLFRRASQPEDPRPAIAAFWQWWAQNRSAVLSAAAHGRREELTGLLGPAVAALHPDLTFAVDPGHASFHRLVVTAGGRADLLAIAERWRLAAPEPDDEVEYASQREADPHALERTRDIEGFQIALAELSAVARVDRRRSRVDVVVHHPLFPLLDREQRLDVATRAVHAVLGEDRAERWLGEVEVSADVALDPIPVSALPAVVDQLAPRRSGGQGRTGSWVALTGKAGKHEVRATVRRPFGPQDAPLCDTHLAVVLPYAAGPDGLPAEPGVAQRVTEFVDELVVALGGDGPHVVVVGQQTGGGRVIVHLYVDGLEVDPEVVRPLLTRWSEGTASMRARHDPAYRGVGHLLA